VNQKWLDSYKTASVGKRTIVRPGDHIPIKGLQALVVSSDQKLLTTPLGGGGPNPLCANAEQKAPAGPENQSVLGMLLTYGRFKFLALIDLDWEKEIELVCPVNKLGTVTVYQSSRHGSFDGAGAPAFLGAIRPRVVVVNNGPRKGLGNRRHLAGTSFAVGQRRQTQHFWKHDRQFRGNIGVQGEFDQGIG
jgi:hypothetical protein